MSLFLWDPLKSPRALNQRFGLGINPDEVLSSLISPFQRNLFINPTGYLSPNLFTEPGSVSMNEDKFEVSVDVQHFTPDEINVKIVGNTISVEGKHEEKPDEHGYIYRHFVRKYVIPENHELNLVQSFLSSDGVLTVTVPKKGITDQGIKQIPIQQTGQPSKPTADLIQQVESREKASAVVDGEKIIPVTQEGNACAFVSHPKATEEIQGEKIIHVTQEGDACAFFAQPKAPEEIQDEKLIHVTQEGSADAFVPQPKATEEFQGEKIIPVMQEGNSCAFVPQPKAAEEFQGEKIIHVTQEGNACAFVPQPKATEEFQGEKIIPVLQEGNACAIVPNVSNESVVEPVISNENPREKIITITQE